VDADGINLIFYGMGVMYHTGYAGSTLKQGESGIANRES